MSAAGFKKNRYNIKPSTLLSGGHRQIFFLEKTLYRSSLVSECQAHCTSVMQYKVCCVLLALVETTQVQAYYYLRPFSILWLIYYYQQHFLYGFRLFICISESKYFNTSLFR